MNKILCNHEAHEEHEEEIGRIIPGTPYLFIKKYAEDGKKIEHRTRIFAD